MPSLGSFGKTKPAADPLTFDFFGESIRVDPAFGQLDFVDFMAAAQTVDTEAPSAMVLLKDLLTDCIHDEDFERFWRTARERRQDVTDLMEIVHAVVEAVADRPTGSSADSSAGPSSGAPSSTDDSSSWAIEHRERQGRPDLALIHMQAQEARAAV